MASPQPYRAASFSLSGLRGISDKTLETLKHLDAAE